MKKKSKQAPPRRVPNQLGLDTQIAFRADAALVGALDREVERANADRPWARMKRSDVVRELCWKALNAETQE